MDWQFISTTTKSTFELCKIGSPQIHYSRNENKQAYAFNTARVTYNKTPEVCGSVLHGNRNSKIPLDNRGNTAGAVMTTTFCAVGILGVGLTTVVFPWDREYVVLLSCRTGITQHSHSHGTAIQELHSHYSDFCICTSINIYFVIIFNIKKVFNLAIYVR